LERVVTSPIYHPTGWPVEPRPEQYDTAQTDPRLGGHNQPGAFAESELDYALTEGPRDNGDPMDSGSGSSSTVDTAKGEAANVKDPTVHTAKGEAANVKDATVHTAKGETADVKDTAVDAAVGVNDVAASEASSVAEEAKYQARSLVDQTRFWALSEHYCPDG
jgi:hypothetical protein